MSILRRFDPNNRPVFLTCVTHERQPLLTSIIRPLTAAVFHVQKHGVIVSAWAILPDHIHALIDLNGQPLSSTVHRFKRKLSAICYRRSIRGRLWQHRFWDHVIRDERDLNRHIDYIHFNPVKHGLVSDPSEWKWSSYRDWTSERDSAPDWGRVLSEDGSEFGE